MLGRSIRQRKQRSHNPSSERNRLSTSSPQSTEPGMHYTTNRISQEPAMVC